MAGARKQPKGKIYVATQNFTTDYDGVPVSVTAGVTHVREGHPMLLGREVFFKELEVEYEMEAATAAPGEKRGE
ncbi:MAG: hypothetical protein OEW53_04025 [Actinomycetota bacterium]|nr:hypothetical protein [Actinomycetota bacterium]